MENRIVQPTDLEMLKEFLCKDEKKLFIAGGTDMMIRLRNHTPVDTMIIDLSQMESLKQWRMDEQGLHLGALCTMTQLSESKLIQRSACVLAQAASKVGSTQTRNRATIGGNVANAAQCADTIPALIALDAQVILMDVSGHHRHVKVENFVVGIGKTQITQREVIVGFFISREYLDFQGAFSKIGSRETVTIAKVNCAAVALFENGAISKARIAFGSLGQSAFYSKLVSERLIGMTAEQLKEDSYISAFVEQVDSAIPGRDSLSYKRSAVKAVAVSIADQLLNGSREA